MKRILLFSIVLFSLFLYGCDHVVELITNTGATPDSVSGFWDVVDDGSDAMIVTENRYTVYIVPDSSNLPQGIEIRNFAGEDIALKGEIRTDGTVVIPEQTFTISLSNGEYVIAGQGEVDSLYRSLSIKYYLVEYPFGTSVDSRETHTAEINGERS